jgi:hypothetical protein
MHRRERATVRRPLQPRWPEERIRVAFRVGNGSPASPTGRWPTAWALPAMLPAGSSTETASVRAVDRDGEGSADLPHACVGQPSEPLSEDRDRDALDRVQVDHAMAGHRVLVGLEADFR